MKLVLHSAPFLSQCPPNCGWTNGAVIVVCSSDAPYPPNSREWELLACAGFTYRSFRQANCWDKVLCRAVAAHWSPRSPETVAGIKRPTFHHRQQRGEENRAVETCPSTAIKRNSSGVPMCLSKAGGSITVAVNTVVMATRLYGGTTSQLGVVQEVITPHNHCKNKVLFKDGTDGGQTASPVKCVVWKQRRGC